MVIATDLSFNQAPFLRKISTSFRDEGANEGVACTDSVHGNHLKAWQMAGAFWCVQPDSFRA
jgi:hypothetical protein